jgi:penicillin-binding protein 1B
MESSKPRIVSQPALARRSAIRLGLIIGEFILTIAVACVLVKMISAYDYYSTQIHARLTDNSLHRPSGIYAAPRRVSVGQQINKAELTERLSRAGYQGDGQAGPFAVGHFTTSENTIEVRTNEFARRDNLPETVRIVFDKTKSKDAGKIKRIESAADNRALPLIDLPAEMITTDINSKNQVRSSADYQDLPPVLIKALTAIEDRRFFEHRGIDVIGIARAFFRNLKEGEIREGASTITQQLVKTEFLNPERTYERKFAEAMMAMALEEQLSKEQIMTLYCDRVFLGQSGINTIYGFKQAAEAYFGKQLSELTLGEAAFLAGLVKAPNRYSPYNNLKAATERRNVVLDSMVDVGSIDSAEADRAKGERLSVRPPQPMDDTASPYFVDYLKRELELHYSQEAAPHRRIETSLDLDLQEAANKAIEEQLSKLDKSLGKRRGNRKPEAALIALDPHTGEILAMVGGRDYSASQLNRVTDARRQPGSVFKPFVYAAALSKGISPTTTFMDAPQDFDFGYKAVYSPDNYGGRFSHRPVMLREGIVRSLNVVAVEAGKQVGFDYLAELAERSGLPRIEPYPSMALGAFEATPLEVARAYTVFANSGWKVEPTAIRAIVNGDDSFRIWTTKSAILSSSVAYVVTDTLSEVVDRGTATYIRRAGCKVPVAGKTGTSRDSWFAGYTPNLLVVVWVGFDDYTDLGLTGGQAAVPIWTAFIKRALALRPDLAAGKFPQPSGLETVEVDASTGMLANAYCPSRKSVSLASWMIPSPCYEHYAPLPEYDEFGEEEIPIDFDEEILPTPIMSPEPPGDPPPPDRYQPQARRY